MPHRHPPTHPNHHPKRTLYPTLLPLLHHNTCYTCYTCYISILYSSHPPLPQNPLPDIISLPVVIFNGAPPFLESIYERAAHSSTMPVAPLPFYTRARRPLMNTRQLPSPLRRHLHITNHKKHCRKVHFYLRISFFFCTFARE